MNPNRQTDRQFLLLTQRGGCGGGNDGDDQTRPSQDLVGTDLELARRPLLACLPWRQPPPLLMSNNKLVVVRFV
jgi:hypothetical protein